jgi:EAL and modified HD-GYP domain-containing signal transduction protein
VNEHPILAQLVLGYCPMMDRQRAIVATRLTVFPQRPELAPDARAMMAALAEAWPQGSGCLLYTSDAADDM